MVERIGRATQRLAKLHARRKLEEMRLAILAREQERKLATRRRLGLGEAMDRAGFAHWACCWSPATISVTPKAREN